MGRNTCLSLLFSTLVAASGAHADTILVSSGSTIGAYTTSGATVNASLITGLSNPGSLTLSGSDLFVELGGNTIGEYTTGGATVNAALITGLNNVHQISSFGSNIFVANGNPTNTIGEYTTAGATVNSALISGVNVAHGAASNGANIFVLNNGNGNPGTGFISEYTPAGGLVNASLITGLSSPEEILILGSNIFVTNFVSGTVGEYTTSGGTVNAALISGLNGPFGIATDGTNLYVSNALGGTVSEYTTSGVLVNAALISGLSQPQGIAVVPTASGQTYYFSQLAFAGGWQMTLTYINYSPRTVTCVTNFFSDGGGALPVPFSGGTVSSRTDILQPGQSIHDQSVADLNAMVSQGWAQATCNGPIQASLLYRLYQSGVPVGEAGVNAETAPTTKFVTFAQTATGVAYGNPSTTQSATITITVINAAGAPLGNKIIILGPLAHGAANLGPLLGLQSFTGSVDITSTIPIISLSLNFEVFPVFSSLPPGDLPSSTTLVN